MFACLQLSLKGWGPYPMVKWQVTCLELLGPLLAVGRLQTAVLAKAGLEAYLAEAAAAARPLRSAACSLYQHSTSNSSPRHL